MTNKQAHQTASPEHFVAVEAMLLDQRRYGEWLELFAETSTYWIPVDPETTSPDSLCHAHDDRQRLSDRIDRLSGALTEEPPSRSSRVLGRSVRLDDDDGNIVLWTPFHMVVNRRDVDSFLAGSCVHHLVADGETFKIRVKRVNLIEAQSPLASMTVIL